MSDPGDDRLRSAWARHTEQTIDVDPTKAEANVRRRQAAITRRDRIVYLSASIIGPSMLAVSWFRPDLRLASVPGVFIALWLPWQMYRRSGARLPSASVDLPCLAYQRALLERERAVVLSMPKRYLGPLVVGQLAIAATMATNPRFTGSRLFPEGLVLFVGTGVVVLTVAWRRWRREAMELQQELENIGRS